MHPDDAEWALRPLILEVEFDGRRTVWCPVGDFFGSGYRWVPFSARFREVSADGTLACHRVMPFRESATVRLRNLSDRPVRILDAAVQTGPWEWDERSLLFHASWAPYPLIDTATFVHGGRDFNYAVIHGVGKYVGDTLALFNAGPRKAVKGLAWWGEGDEKIYVDGSEFPDHFGTGTEDYYGYAWCRPEPFASAFNAQPCGEGNLEPGYTVNSRWRVLDAIPFRHSLRVDMEVQGLKPVLLQYAAAAFWYARPGAVSLVLPEAEEAARPTPLRKEDLLRLGEHEETP
jgi:hypothetical protein